MTHKIQLVLYSAAMVLIGFLAYAGLIPTKLHDIPYYDSIGHFILYGWWGYLLGKVFHKSVSGTTFRLPHGIILATAIAIVEETLQQLSPMRSFSLYDLGFDLLGIATSAVVLNHHFRNRKE
ncbi:hypothetical protein FLLO111716_01600 [Flavobacterium longum]|uniref:VanZ family protein n=1 Tax=Flavobacterium longum TaxID=1299340 RepID=UPI0039EC0FB8